MAKPFRPTARRPRRAVSRRATVTGTVGTVEIAVPRARIGGADGGIGEWKSRTLPRYARMTRQVEALIAGTYLAGTNSRRVRRALAALFKGAIGKDAVSRGIRPDASSQAVFRRVHKPT